MTEFNHVGCFTLRQAVWQTFSHLTDLGACMVYVEAVHRRPQLVSAARNAFARSGVTQTPLRAVAAEAGVPLGTLQHLFPTKEKLLRAVIEDVVEEIAKVLSASAEADRGLEHAIRTGLTGFWDTLVETQWGLQLMQYELTVYALRAAGQEELARWQYDRYAEVVAEWCERATQGAGESCAVPFEQLARVMLAGMDGLILQHVCDPDRARSRQELEVLSDALVRLIRS